MTKNTGKRADSGTKAAKGQISISGSPAKPLSDDRGMWEKYLHSEAAHPSRTGRFRDAVDLLYKAVTIDDQPYLHHDLSRAFRGLGELDKALDQITKAIALAALVPDYYDFRAASGLRWVIHRG